MDKSGSDPVSRRSVGRYDGKNNKYQCGHKISSNWVDTRMSDGSTNPNYKYIWGDHKVTVII